MWRGGNRAVVDSFMAIWNRFGQARAHLLGLARNDQVRLTVLAALVGAAASYAAILFRALAAVTALLLFGAGEESMAEAARSLPAWQVVMVPTLGGLAIGLACRYLLPRPLPQGVAEVMEAAALHSGRMKLKLGLAAAGLSAFSIGIGGSVGREGPIVHLGATLAAQVARWLRFGPSFSRTLLGCGVAAAIATAFNAPIAGVFFALELVIGHYGLGAFAPVVIASLVGTIVVRVHIGDHPAFDIDPQAVVSFWEVPGFLLLGAVAAGAAIMLMGGIALVQRLHETARIPDWLRPALGGAGLGLIALVFPEVLGVGYQATETALGAMAEQAELLALLVIAKTAATALCHGSGFGGGMFSPSLTVGALVGGLFGSLATAAFPGLASSLSVYALLGMGAVAASVLGAPISTVIIIFEMTTDYGITFALMGTVAVASLVTHGLWGRSYFHWLLAERGLTLDDSRELGILRGRLVADVLRRDVITVPATADLDELKRRFRLSHAPIFVVGDDQELKGSISIGDLLDAAFAGDPPAGLTAAELARPSPVVLRASDDLADAYSRCRTHEEEHVPVVEDRAGQKILGEIRYSDLLRAYNQALLEARAIERGLR